MKELLHWLKKKSDIYTISAFVLVLIGFFLRTYKFEGFITFLGDQGRDAIIIKRIVTFEHFPAIGASMSVGHVYLGPFYYYFIAPWLALFNLNPLGLGVGVSVVSTFFIWTAYFMVKDIFDKKIALLTTFFITCSYILIEFSRFSWNPNLLPGTSLVLMYALYKGFQKRKWYFFFLAGSFLSIAIQLHYLALILALPIAIVFLIDIVSKKKWIQHIKEMSIFSAAFTLLSTPLIIFDLRHQFINTNSFINLFSSKEAISGDRIQNAFMTLTALIKYALNVEISVYLILIAIVGMVIYLKKRNKNDALVFVSIFFIFSLLVLSLYGGAKNPHYFGAVYPIFYILLAYLLLRIKKPLSILIISISMIFFVYTNSKNYYAFHLNPSYQLNIAQQIASIIYHNATKSYTVTALPYMYSDATYRYYLEIWGKKPAEKDVLVRTDELFVICEGECKPIGDAQWDIAFFAPNKIVGEWKTNNVTIYKLIR